MGAERERGDRAHPVTAGHVTNGTVDSFMRTRRSCRVLAGLTAFVLWVVVAIPAARAQDSWEHPAADATAPSGPPPPAAAVDDARHDTTVVVHVDASEPVELLRRDAAGDWQTVCFSPCDRPIAEHGAYRVGGGGVRPSPEFSLADRGPRVVLQARPSSSGWFVGGIVLVSVGGAGIGVGAFVATVVASLQGVGGASGAHDSGDPASTTRAGIVTMAAGAVAVAAGIVAIVSNRSTDVLVRAPVTAVAPEVMNCVGPIWRAPSSVEMARPAAIWTPIFVSRF